MIETTSDYPIPGEGRGRKPLYPFKTMEADESFPVPEGKLGSVRSLASEYSTGGKLFSVMKIEDGHRCWRVK